MESNLNKTKLPIITGSFRKIEKKERVWVFVDDEYKNRIQMVNETKRGVDFDLRPLSSPGRCNCTCFS